MPCLTKPLAWRLCKIVTEKTVLNGWLKATSLFYFFYLDLSYIIGPSLAV